MPDEKLLTEMTKYNEELVAAGVMLAGDGLHPSSRGARIRYTGSGKPVVTDGPFPETKELVAGFWIWKVASKEEALQWLERAPFGKGAELELRQVFEAEEFGEAFTPELRKRERALLEQAERNART
jgi:hypothetical protein